MLGSSSKKQMGRTPEAVYSVLKVLGDILASVPNPNRGAPRTGPVAPTWRHASTTLEEKEVVRVSCSALRCAGTASKLAAAQNLREEFVRRRRARSWGLLSSLLVQCGAPRA